MDRMLPASSSLRSAVLPGLTVLLGTGGVLGGLYSFQSPFEWARQFGVVCSSDSKSSLEHRALIQTIGIRNIASGGSLLALTAFWQFSALCRASPVAAVAVKRSLGLTLLVGTVVAMTDSVVLSQLAKGGSLSAEDEGFTTAASKGHAFISLPILGLALGYLLT